jgi:hypothetical protein
MSQFLFWISEDYWPPPYSGGPLLYY